MKNNLFRLEEKTAVLTGPFTQLQVAITQRLTENGCSVAIIDENPKEAERFCQQLNGQLEINPRFGRAQALTVDWTQGVHIQEALNSAAETFGSVDIYIDGLMLFRSGSFADTMELEDLDRMIDINLKAPIQISHRVVKILRNRRKSRMIFLVGDLQLMGGRLEALNAATRNGVIGLCQSLARELPADVMTANCVSLGASEEYLQQVFDHCRTISAAQEEMQREFPLLKTTDVQSVADTICFLASPLSSAINGQVISASQGLKV